MKKILGILVLLGCVTYASIHYSHKGTDTHVHGAGYAAWVAGPTSAPLSPSDALKSFKIADQYTIQLVAAEPLVQEPVAIKFDAAGNLWVAEMTNYMLDIAGTGQTNPAGNIVFLKDTDGDGLFDERRVFLENLSLPRAFTFVKDGLLIADNQSLYHVKKDANDQAGTLSVVDPDFAAGSGVEKKANGLVYGLDNWIYNAFSNRRYKVLQPADPLPNHATLLFENDQIKIVRALTERRGQWGLAIDDHGRWFYNHNSVLLITDKFPANSVYRRDALSLNLSTQHRLGDNYVYPIRPTLGINRGYVAENLNDEDKLIKATAASGLTIFRGTKAPSLYGHAIIPEPAANLVTAKKINRTAKGISAAPVPVGSALLASTDERFRPVNVANGPDGSIYIADMYRGILQDRFYLTSYLANYILGKNLDKGVHFGRLYRLREKGAQRDRFEDLSYKRPSELVPYLTSPNGWTRDTVRRLLIQARDPASMSLVRDLLHDAAHRRFHLDVLWTLQGLQDIQKDDILRSLNSPQAMVALHALKMGAALPVADQAAIVSALTSHALMASEDMENLAHLVQALTLYTDPKALALIASVLEAKPAAEELLILAAIGMQDRQDALLNAVKSPQQKARLQEIFTPPVRSIASEASHLTDVEKLIYNHGKNRYQRDFGCAGCHGEKGEGLEFAGPPLAASQWVTVDKRRLAALLLHGVKGPITVGGNIYAPDMEMPGLIHAENAGLNDVASLVNYLRNSWGHQGDFITIEEVRSVADQTKDRTTPYTETELLDAFPK